MEEVLSKSYHLLTSLSPITNELPLEAFGSLICMLLEEWCKHNKENIIEFISNMKELIILVNAEQGSY